LVSEGKTKEGFLAPLQTPELLITRPVLAAGNGVGFILSTRRGADAPRDSKKETAGRTDKEKSMKKRGRKSNVWLKI